MSSGLLGSVTSFVDGMFDIAESYEDTFDSIAGILENGFYTIDQILDRIPPGLLPADVRRYLDDAEGLLDQVKGVKSDIFNSYLYNTRELYEMMKNWDGTYSDSIMMSAPPKPVTAFDGWSTAQQNFWEVRILSRDKGKLPKYFAVLPAIDCSMCIGEVDISSLQALGNNMYYVSRKSSGSAFSITFLDDESLSIAKFLRAWISSITPRPGVYLPTEKSALDMEFRKFTRNHKEVFYRKVKVLPDGELGLNFSAVSDDDIQTPFTFKIIGEESN